MRPKFVAFHPRPIVAPRSSALVLVGPRSAFGSDRFSADRVRWATEQQEIAPAGEQCRREADLLQARSFEHEVFLVWLSTNTGLGFWSMESV